MNWNSRSRLNFAHALNKFTHSYTFTLKLLQFSFPILGEFPDLWNSSQRFLRVDQAPLPSSGTGPDLGQISQGWCLLSPDKTARWVGPFLLGAQDGSRLFRELGRWGKGGPGIPLGGTPPRSVLCPSLLWCSPALAGGSQGQSVGISLGPPNVGEYFDRQEAKQNSEEWITQILFLCQRTQTCTCVWALSKGFIGYSKGSAGRQVTRNVLPH
jgi:hypothetical protein